MKKKSIKEMDAKRNPVSIDVFSKLYPNEDYGIYLRIWKYCNEVINDLKI